MPSEWQIDCLKSRLRSLSGEIRRVKEKHAPYAPTHRIYAALREILASFDKLLGDAERRADLNRPRTIEHLDDTYVVVGEELTKVTKLFRICDRTDSPRIPFEILRSLGHVATDLAGMTTEIVVHLSTEYNYEITSLSREFAQSRWTRWWLEAAEPSAASSDVLLMIFPSYEVATTLLHAAAAHELGHVLAHRMEAQIASALAGIADAVKLELARERTEYVEVQGVPREMHDSSSENAWRTLQFRDLINETKWVRETFADLLAARLVGPAYLAVMDRLSVDYRGDISHPPVAIRRQIILNYLRHHLRHVAVDPAWRDVKRGEAPPPPNDIATRCGSQICLRAMTALGRIVDTIPTPLANRHELASAVKVIAKRLDNLAPPSLDIVVPDGEAIAPNFWLLLYTVARYRVSVNRFDAFCARYGWSNNPDLADTALNSMLLHGLQNLDVKLRWATTK
jgi:hypothetical protein